MQTTLLHALGQCGPGTTAYSTIMDKINASSFLNSLETLYTAILTHAGSAQVYVADYPYVAPDGATSGAGLDLSGARAVEGALNNQIALAVATINAGNPSLHFVETNYSGPPFEGHDLCSESASYFNGLVAPPNTEYSIHPNTSGHSAFAAVFSAANALGCNHEYVIAR